LLQGITNAGGDALIGIRQSTVEVKQQMHSATG
jgi:hypothetical protein